MDSLFEPLENFRGVARLFPLPNLVLFPHAAAPLHIFEPRYRAMVEEALSGDELIAMARLRPGWEANYEGRPPIASIVCVGRILTHARLPSGRFNLLLAGVQRGAIVQELPPSKLFREAKAKLLDDVYEEAGAERHSRLREKLREAVHRHLPASPTARQQLEQLMARPLPLGTLADVLAHAVPWPVEIKQQLLEELDVDRRAALLLERLQEDEPPGAPVWPYPPNFSDN
ncbi:MAG: LON peptidase substrate-binding domain-containing protein [Planctomycetes bacterium]|nr:LON peptidase substrate-binding domain-containing protein [Planctomycetota bacterium]